MRTFLIVLFAAILAAMIAITTLASFERSILAAVQDLMSDRWFQATLLDAYFGFLTFYVWVAYKERLMWSRILWFALIMCLGNIAMAIYMLIELCKLPRNVPVSSMLVNTAPESQTAIGP